MNLFVLEYDRYLTKSFDNAMLDSGDVAELGDAVNNVTGLC